MSEFKGTQGKWQVVEQQTTNGSFFRIKGGTEKVANIVTRDYQRAEANAALIAHAPELLELCDMVYKSFGGGNIITFSDGDIEKFRSAIIKSTLNQ